MKIFKEIFIKEIQLYLYDKKLIITWIGIILLMVINSFIFLSEHNLNQKKYETIVKQNAEKLDLDVDKYLPEIMYALHVVNMDEKIVEEYLQTKLSDLIFINQQIPLEPAKLAFISSSKKDIPNGITLNYFGIGKPVISTQNGNRLSNIELDWTNLIVYVISFICICFSYNIFSGEKINGTLKLIFTNNISRSTILLAKYLSVLIVLITPILIGMLINIIILNMSNIITLSSNDYLMILLFIVSMILFISVIILLVMIISIKTSTPSVSLVISLLIWMLFAVVVPNTSWILSKYTSPIQSINSIYTTRNKTFEREKLGKYEGWWSDRWNNKEPEKGVYKWKNTVDRMDQVHNNLLENYKQSIFKQTNTAIKFTNISPFKLFQNLSDKICDNNFYRYVNFYNQIKNYHKSYQQQIVEIDSKDENSYHLIWNDEKTKSFMSNKTIKGEEILKFTYKNKLVGKIIYSSLTNLLLLFVWATFLFVLSFIFLIRYDVR